MKIALLGYGKEGQAAEKYFKEHFDAECEIFQNFTPEEIKQRDYSSYDIIMRSPSVPPMGLPNESSVTRYFFDHCPCPIIGVTGTKGKGTTCSLIYAILEALGKKVHLVGNIGRPAIEVLDNLAADDVVVYEMSSFQLWDLEKSPRVAVIGHLEPDHLNVHRDYAEYLAAKANITRFQGGSDYLVYNAKNTEAAKIAESSNAICVPYPFELDDEVARAVRLPGRHNIENAMAAIAATACYLQLSVAEFLRRYGSGVIAGIGTFRGLPHRLEYLRELNGVKYYDDNFSTNPSSTRVAVQAFPDNDLVMIIGGRDKTNYEDLPEIYEILKAPQVKKIILMGESGRELGRRYDDARFVAADSLEQAVATAKSLAEGMANGVVVMSPAAASFDMFENVYDRGDQYQKLIRNL